MICGGMNDWANIMCEYCLIELGGEIQMLCCLTIATKSPDIIVLDEPTNNLDIQNIEILTAVINEYQGTIN